MMPYFRWIAIDLDAQEYEGELWAPNIKQLEKELLKEKLGLMRAERIKLAFVEHWSMQNQLVFFENIAQLINAGLLVSQALQVLVKQGAPIQRRLADELYHSVTHGCSLAEALQGYKTLFSPLAVSLIQSGQDSGQLIESCNSLIDFLRMRVLLRQKIRSAIRVPLITFGFFIALILIIFLAIVPSFEQLTMIAKQGTNTSLHKLLAWSHWLQQVSFLRFILFTIICGLLTWFASKMQWFKFVKSWLVVHLPFTGGVYWLLSLSLFFQAVSLLMRGGKSLLEAMELAASLSQNDYIRNALQQFAHVVSGGQSIEDSYEMVFDRKASPDVIAMLSVGNESGTLAFMCETVAKLYFERAEKRLKSLSIILQPLLMVIMGMLVAMLIYAVYVQSMQLPELMSTVG
jgi:type II secretory pathway component PulF